MVSPLIDEDTQTHLVLSHPNLLDRFVEKVRLGLIHGVDAGVALVEHVPSVDGNGARLDVSPLPLLRVLVRALYVAMGDEIGQTLRQQDGQGVACIGRRGD